MVLYDSAYLFLLAVLPLTFAAPLHTGKAIYQRDNAAEPSDARISSAPFVGRYDDERNKRSQPTPEKRDDTIAPDVYIGRYDDDEDEKLSERRPEELKTPFIGAYDEDRSRE